MNDYAIFIHDHDRKLYPVFHSHLQRSHSQEAFGMGRQASRTFCKFPSSHSIESNAGLTCHSRGHIALIQTDLF